MDKLITTNNGGIPYVNDDLRWLLGQASNQGVYQALQSHLLAFGTDYIVQGCTESGGTVAEGWVMLNSELLKVESHTWGSGGYFEKVITYDTTGDKTTRSGSSIQTYQENRATATAVAGTLLYTGIRYENICYRNKSVSKTGISGDVAYTLEQDVDVVYCSNYTGGRVTPITLPLTANFINKKVIFLNLQGNHGSIPLSDFINLTIPTSHFLN
jgi:hypothetical protein